MREDASVVKRNSSRRFSADARERLGAAHKRARQAAGFKHRPAYATAADVALRSVVSLERGEVVGEYILNSVGRFLPGWDEGTAWTILEGGPIPPSPGPLARLDATTVGAAELPPIFHADDATLMGIIEDRAKIGTNEWLEVLGILLADNKITREAYVYALTVGRQVRQARKEAERKIDDLRQSLTDRVRADLSE